MDCWRISSRLLVAFVLTVGPLACGGARNDGRIRRREGGEAPPPASENNINAMPRDRVQDGGRLTWPIELHAGSLTTTVTSTEPRETTPTRSFRCCRGFFSRTRARRRYWNPRLPGIRARTGDRAEAGRHLQHQPESDLVRRHADHVERLPLAVACANGSNKAYQISSSNRLLRHREYCARSRRPRSRGDLQEQVADWQALFYGFFQPRPPSRRRSSTTDGGNGR